MVRFRKIAIKPKSRSLKSVQNWAHLNDGPDFSQADLGRGKQELVQKRQRGHHRHLIWNRQHIYQISINWRFLFTRVSEVLNQQINTAVGLIRCKKQLHQTNMSLPNKIPDDDKTISQYASR